MRGRLSTTFGSQDAERVMTSPLVLTLVCSYRFDLDAPQLVIKNTIAATKSTKYATNPHDLSIQTQKGLAVSLTTILPTPDAWLTLISFASP